MTCIMLFLDIADLSLSPIILPPRILSPPLWSSFRNLEVLLFCVLGKQTASS